jgi:hypothetical protein
MRVPCRSCNQQPKREDAARSPTCSSERHSP